MPLPPLPLIPASVVGSYTIPSWLTVALGQIRQGAFGRFDIRETLDDAVTVAIDDQVRAGVDVISDGEMRRQDFIMSFYDRLAGLRALEPARKVGVMLYDRMAVYEAVDRITAPTGLGIVEEFQFARPRTDRPLKATCPGPLTLTTPLKVGAPYRNPLDAAEDLSAIIRAELLRLVDAGADFIPVDEPAFHPLFAKDSKEVIALCNRTVAGVRAKIAMHICFGNLYGRPRTRRTYAPILPHLRDLQASQLVLEFANRELAELDLWQKYGGDKELAAGLIDIRTFHAESAEEVADRIRAALKVAAPQRLWVVPDCGFCFVPRWLAFAKMKAMVEGARIVRRELGDEAERNAARGRAEQIVREVAVRQIVDARPPAGVSHRQRAGPRHDRRAALQGRDARRRGRPHAGGPRVRPPRETLDRPGLQPLRDPRWIGVARLRAMVAGARIVRKELGGA